MLGSDITERRSGSPHKGGDDIGIKYKCNIAIGVYHRLP